MIRINLLPYREIRYAARLRQFLVLMGGVLLIGVGLVILVSMGIKVRSSSQHSRNDYLTSEIAKLDKKIGEIKNLKQQTRQMLDHKQLVESLQTNRSDAAHLLDQLARLMPDGVYLESVDQHGDAVNLQGFAQSGARVSTLMNNLNGSPWLTHASLIEIKAATVQNMPAYAFSLHVNTTSNKVEAERKIDTKKGG
jgi:type IV pilus assembly protein PilN